MWIQTNTQRKICTFVNPAVRWESALQEAERCWLQRTLVKKSPSLFAANTFKIKYLLRKKKAGILWSVRCIHVWLWKGCWLVELLLSYFTAETERCWSTGLELTLLSSYGPVLPSGLCSTYRSAPPGRALFLGAFVINANTSGSSDFTNRPYIFFRV